MVGSLILEPVFLVSRLDVSVLMNAVPIFESDLTLHQDYAAYAGSKAPLEDFSRAAAQEAGSRGITVNVVA